MTVCTRRDPAFLPLAIRMLDGESLRPVRRDLTRLVGQPPRRDLHLGLSGVGQRKSYRNVKHYKRRKRWLS